MEYSKETEKFAFGFGTDKAIGKAKVKELHKAESSKKSDKKELAELIVSICAVLGTAVLKLTFRKKKKEKSKKRKK